MPETSKDKPTIAVRGERVSATERSMWNDFLKTVPAWGDRNRAATLIEPTDLLPSPSVNILISLEKMAVNEELLPIEIQSALPSILRFFRNLAVEEGLVDVDQNLSVQILFIPKDDYIQAFPTNPATFLPSTRKIYVSYDGLHTPQKIMELLVAVGHELRHRLARMHVEMVIKKDRSGATAPKIIGNVFFQLSRLHARESQGTENHFFEELFTVGWTLDHLADFIPPAVIQTYLDDYAQRRTVDRKAISVYDALEKDGFLVGQHLDLFSIWNGFKEAISNWEGLLIQARSGDAKSVAPLTQEIVRAFGKEGLLALTYVKDSTFQKHLLVFDYLFQLRSQKKYTEEVRREIRERDAVLSADIEPTSDEMKMQLIPDLLQERLARYEEMVAKKEKKLHEFLLPLLKEGGYRGTKLSLAAKGE